MVCIGALDTGIATTTSPARVVFSFKSCKNACNMKLFKTIRDTDFGLAMPEPTSWKKRTTGRDKVMGFRFLETATGDLVLDWQF